VYEFICIYVYIYTDINIYEYVCIYLHLYINICIHPYIHINIYIHICIRVNMYIYIRIYIYIHIHVYIYIYMGLCINIYLYICIYIITHAYTYYIYIHKNPPKLQENDLVSGGHGQACSLGGPWTGWIGSAPVQISGCDDDDCFYYHSWRNNVVIAFGTLSSFLT